MKKFLQSSCQWLVMLVAMFAMSVSAMAESETFTFDENTSFPVTQGPITVAGTQGTSIDAAYAGLLIYRTSYAGTFTAAGGAVITKIEFQSDGVPVPSTGSMTGRNWNGSAASISFTGDYAPYAITKAVVTYEAGTGGNPDPTPDVDPD